MAYQLVKTAPNGTATYRAPASPDAPTVTVLPAQTRPETVPQEIWALYEADFDAEARAAMASQYRAYEDETAAIADPGPERGEAIKAECSRRILGHADAHTQMNLAAHRGAGLLDEADIEVWEQCLHWFTKMQEACRSAIDSGNEPEWPAPPSGLAGLARRY